MHKHLGIWLTALALWAGSVTVALADFQAGMDAARNAAHVEGVLAGLGVILLGATVYFIPSIVARSKKHKNFSALLVLNIFLGVTYVGWVIALVWALIKEQHKNHSEDKSV